MHYYLREIRLEVIERKYTHYEILYITSIIQPVDMVWSYNANARVKVIGGGVRVNRGYIIGAENHGGFKYAGTVGLNSCYLTKDG